VIQPAADAAGSSPPGARSGPEASPLAAAGSAFAIAGNGLASSLNHASHELHVCAGCLGRQLTGGHQFGLLVLTLQAQHQGKVLADAGRMVALGEGLLEQAFGLLGVAFHRQRQCQVIQD